MKVSIKKTLKLLLSGMLLLSTFSTSGKIWQVGSVRTYKYCSELAPLVQHGDTVEIDAGTYTNDAQVSWNKNNLYIKGVGGRPVLIAGAKIATDPSDGKGIFVTDGTNQLYENIEFRNAKCLSHNGAGIRIQSANITIKNCTFDGNEMGVLSGNATGSTIRIEHSHFLNGGSIADPGYQHNIYINHVDSFIFRFNYTHDAIADGHELKSRATFNYIAYNRIANITSTDSRCIDLPNGGIAILLGNIIEQGMNTTNSNMVGYGLEGLTNTGPHHLFVAHNSFVNKMNKGSFIHVGAGTDTLYVHNNAMVGPKTGGLIIGSPLNLDSSNNFISDVITSAGFADASTFNYHLLANSPLRDAGVLLSRNVRGHSLNPVWQFKDSADYEVRTSNGVPDIGAFEYAIAGGYSTTQASAPTFEYYPNPASSTVHMHATIKGYYSLSDIQGKTWQQGEINDAATLDLTNLPAGLYFITLQTDDLKTNTYKLTKP